MAKSFRHSIAIFILALSLTACGGDSGTSANNDISSSSVTLSGTSVTSNGSKASSSSNKVSSSSRGNSVGSSSVGKSSSSSKNVAAFSSSVDAKHPCSRENGVYNNGTQICRNGFLEPYVQSSSSQKVLTFKERFPKDSVFNDQIEYGLFKDPRDNQEYKTVLIKTSYKNPSEFVVFAQNLNYGTQIKLGTTEFDDNKVEKYCYNDDSWYCENYFGGMYSWSEAMGLPKACDSVWTGTTPDCPDSVATGIVYDSDWDHVQIQGACPEGWHVMNEVEWRSMIGGRENGNYSALSRATSGANSYGFSALLGGSGYCTDVGCEYKYIAEYASYWFPKEKGGARANCMDLEISAFYYDRSYPKTTAYSVRCVKDYKRAND